LAGERNPGRFWAAKEVFIRSAKSLEKRRSKRKKKGRTSKAADMKPVERRGGGTKILKEGGKGGSSNSGKGHRARKKIPHKVSREKILWPK